MAPVATDACDLTRHPVDALPEFLFRKGRPQRMLLNKFHIRMAAITGSVNVGNMRHRSRALARKDIMFPVAIKTIRCPLHSFHDHFGMKTLLILFVCFVVATLAIQPPVGSLLSTLGVGIIRYFCMALGAGELSMNRILEARFRYKKRNLFPSGILLR
jgi:hypothetical protein